MHWDASRIVQFEWSLCGVKTAFLLLQTSSTFQQPFACAKFNLPISHYLRLNVLSGVLKLHQLSPLCQSYDIVVIVKKDNQLHRTRQCDPFLIALFDSCCQLRHPSIFVQSILSMKKTEGWIGPSYLKTLSFLSRRTLIEELLHH